MNVFFFITHPSKYYLYRHTINRLTREGHHVDIAIITKDVLEELVKAEGWKYKNIFSEGRRMSGIPVLLSAFLNFFKTFFRVFQYLKDKPFDIYVTNDIAINVGWLKRVPTVEFIDDDFPIIKNQLIVHGFSTAIIAPQCTDLGVLNKKKIGIKSYKELAYLHPKYFTPDFSRIQSIVLPHEKFALIRLVSLTAIHDINVEGISNPKLDKLMTVLKPHCKIFISSERELPSKYESYRLTLPPQYISHLLYFAQMFIGDSQTMTSEAAILGTPSIRHNDFVGTISAMEEKEVKYQLTYGFTSDKFDKMIHKIEELLSIDNLKTEWQRRRDVMLADTEDINEVLYNTIKNYAKK